MATAALVEPQSQIPERILAKLAELKDLGLEIDTELLSEEYLTSISGKITEKLNERRAAHDEVSDYMDDWDGLRASMEEVVTVLRSISQHSKD